MSKRFSFSGWFKNRAVKGRNNFDLFGCDTFEQLHWGKLFLHLHGEFFSRYRIKSEVNIDIISVTLIKKYSLTNKDIIKIDRALNSDFFSSASDLYERLFILKKGLQIAFSNDLVDIMYSPRIYNDEIYDLIKLVDDNKVVGTETRKFYMIQSSNGSLNLAEFDIKSFDIDIHTHYNDYFFPINNIITNSLSGKNKNGLVLLHGKYGSGKTYYLRHLISTIERRFIYFPINLFEAINAPEFLPFISEYPNSILILEDCESILVPRENCQNNCSALSNLLNLGDGLLSDALSVNVICTFNAGLKKIDDAILRKGRLIARYEFKELETVKAQNLANRIGKRCWIDRPLTVSEIYNLEEKSFENKPGKSIGFKVA